MNQKLNKKLKTLPHSPGVYFHKNIDGEVIYVGKASVLKNRVKQYFQSKKDMDAKTLALIKEIADIDWITTESEIDALFLESEMVKRYKPRYNILLRDDKSLSYVRINMRDEIPFVSFTRNPTKDGAEYFGPFFNSFSIKRALRYLRKIFPYYIKPVSLRGASRSNPEKPDRHASPAMTKTSKLEYQIGLTPGVVEGNTSSSDYKKSLRQLISYIKGNRVAVVKEIEKAMKTASKNQDFENAAKYRNQLTNLAELQQQIVFGREEFLDISKDEGLVALRDLLLLPEIPRRIEAFDVSHHGGKNNTASMVVFTNGMPNKTQYRKFKLRTGGNNDYAGMCEAVERRMKHLPDWGRPDLVIIDGGAGQLSAVADLLTAENIPFIGRNKSGKHSRNSQVSLVIRRKSEGVSHRNSNYETIKLDTDNHEAKLIIRIDEEAHRFAISYHTLLKRKNQIAK